jgi:hypothetical protein
VKSPHDVIAERTNWNLTDAHTLGDFQLTIFRHPNYERVFGYTFYGTTPDELDEAQVDRLCASLMLYEASQRV